ncbi:cytochrome P450 4V2-like [Onthophagus taurus]|uniref:cytochrome P450 4V2-like n=1 Tax=Onthophagus taurus TaxID=166361 RepID=UPI0039BDE18A
MITAGFLIIIITVFASLVIWWYLIFYKYKNQLKMFPTPLQVPLLGISYKMRNTVDIYNTMETLVKNFGKNVFAMIGPIPMLVTTDPKVFSAILGSPKHINKPFMFTTALNQVVGNSLLVVNGDEWRRQRRLLNPSLNYKNVMQDNNIFNKHSNGLINKLKEEINNESTDVVHILENFTIEQTLETILGETGAEFDKEKIAECMKLLTQIVLEKMFFPLTYFRITQIFTKVYWEERNAIKITHNILKEFLRRKQKEDCDLKIKGDPRYIDILLGDKNNREVDVIKQLMLATTAASDTIASSLSFILHHLAKSPEIQQKAYEEVHSILGGDIHQTITNQQVAQMKYLDLVIKESLRLSPAIPMYTRILEEDVTYEETTLPKGLTVFMIPFMMHIDPELYPDPEKFIPERFLPENLNPNRYSYAPFNHGVRNCIGKLYAKVSMKIALAKLLLNYEFVDVHHKLFLSVEVTLTSKSGVRVGIRKRNHMK